MKRRRLFDEQSHHEAWAIPYADLLTLLLAFFVVMYAISSVNEGKYRVLSDALAGAFSGKSSQRTPDSNSSFSDAGYPGGRRDDVSGGFADEDPFATMVDAKSDLPIDLGGTSAAEVSAQQQLGKIADEIDQSMAQFIEDDQIRVTRNSLWLEIDIKSDLLFPSGSAQLETPAQDIIRKLAQALATSPNRIRVEGHTDNQPISTTAFPSNWQLSASRATSVIQLLQYAGVDPERMAVMGFGQYKPKSDNITPEGRSANRRVLLIVLAAAPQPDEQAPSEPAGPQANAAPAAADSDGNSTNAVDAAEALGLDPAN